jgi:predicted nucleotidyltransferase
MLNKNKIKNIILQNKSYLKKDYNIAKIGLFGSYAKSKQTDVSDIDLLVDFNTRIGLFKFAKLQNELTDIFKCKIDLVTTASLKEKIKKDILNEVIWFEGL